MNDDNDDHLTLVGNALERIADLAAEAAHPGLSGVTFVRYLVEIGRMAAEARVHLAALATHPSDD